MSDNTKARRPPSLFLDPYGIKRREALLKDPNSAQSPGSGSPSPGNSPSNGTARRPTAASEDGGPGNGSASPTTSSAHVKSVAMHGVGLANRRREAVEAAAAAANASAAGPEPPGSARSAFKSAVTSILSKTGAQYINTGGFGSGNSALAAAAKAALEQNPERPATSAGGRPISGISDSGSESSSVNKALERLSNLRTAPVSKSSTLVNKGQNSISPRRQSMPGGEPSLDRCAKRDATLSRLQSSGKEASLSEDGGDTHRSRGCFMFIKLEDRAMHPFYLQEMVTRGFDSTRHTWKASDIATFTTGDVVNYIIKPATARESVDFVQASARGDVTLNWCASGIMQTPNAPKRPSYGPTTYFVSHAWSYKFTDLVRIIMDHYRHLPGTEDGESYMPVYYWLDIFAVTQHFSGQFTDSTDSDFPRVIRASKQVLCVAIPRLPKPTIFTRVWCLYEILNAVNFRVDIELLMDEMKSVAETSAFDKLDLAVQQWDVRDARATVQVDYRYIMNCITQSPGIDEFNHLLQSRMRDSMLTAQLKMAVERGYHETALHLIEKRGARYEFAHKLFHFERQTLDHLQESEIKEAETKAGGWHKGGRRKEQPLLKVPAGDWAAKVLSEMMKGNTTITSVVLRGVSDEGVVALGKSVASSDGRLRTTAVASLDLSQNALGTASAAALGLVLQHVTSLKILDLRDTQNLGGAGSSGGGGDRPVARQQIATAAVQPRGSGNPALFGGGFRAFATGLAISKSLKELRLDRAGIDAEGASALAEAIANGSAPLTSLVLDGNLIMDVGTNAMANAVARNRALISISLNACGIGHVGATSLAQALSVNAGIVSLSLTDNAAIGDLGVAALAKAIHSGSGRLQKLHLNNVSMSAKSSMLLADALTGAGGSSIKDLDVADNFDLGSKARQHFKKMSRMKEVTVVWDDSTATA